MHIEGVCPAEQRRAGEQEEPSPERRQLSVKSREIFDQGDRCRCSLEPLDGQIGLTWWPKENNENQAVKLEVVDVRQMEVRKAFISRWSADIIVHP